MAKDSPTGMRLVEVDGKTYRLELTHMKAAMAEQLLGTGLLNYSGGGINYNLILGLVLMDGQHGVSTREDVAALLDKEAAKIDEAIFSAVINFFQKNYPKTTPELEKVVQENRAKGNVVTQ